MCSNLIPPFIQIHDLLKLLLRIKIRHVPSRLGPLILDREVVQFLLLYQRRDLGLAIRVRVNVQVLQSFIKVGQAAGISVGSCGLVSN